MSGDSRPALGYGLLAGALGITILMLLWLATSGAEAGGIILGLLLTFVLAGPLAGAGWYVLARGQTEHSQEQAFASKRRVLEADRLFRSELASRLNALAQTSGMPSQELGRLADELQRSVPDESAWYDTIQLDDPQINVLQQYDELVWEQVRWLRDHPGADVATLTEAVTQLRQAIDRRSDLLVRGRPAPAVSPETLLRTPAPAQASGLEQLSVGDAVSRDAIDYIVDRLATAFSNGQTWKLAHLAPSGGGAVEHWLSIAPGALEIAWLDSMPPPQGDEKQLAVDGQVLSLAETSSPVVQVVTAAVSLPGVLVKTWRYRLSDQVALVEQWPEGARFAYHGRTVRPAELELWPGARVAVNQ